jgi:hydroxymethylpyrimidine/phosphomethylpyrimidine kinase
MPSPLPVVLSFAASDPTGGAGVQADVLAIAALGCHPLSVLTGYTVQDTRGVERLQVLDASDVEQQARCVLQDIAVAAFKLGVVGSAANAQTIAKILSGHPRIPVVLDPVLASGRGDALTDAAALQPLLPMTTVLTPNAHEARRLVSASPVAPLAECARALLDLGCAHVLVTGTHEGDGPVLNTLYGASGVLREDRWPRLAGDFHGSGCTLASALAALLALGRDIGEAAREAQAYTWKTLEAGFRPGRGQAVPNRLFDRR